MIVTVIGAGGHVGLPFSLVVAEAGHTVYGYDVNETIVERLSEGNVPYVEHGAEKLLRKHLTKTKRLTFTTNPSYIKQSDVIAIMLGTPVDEENNPRLDSLFDFVDNTLIPFMKKDTLVILRSTVAPGTTEVVRNRIEEKTGWVEGKDFYLVFCPERVLQTKGIEETSKLPQIIGVFNYVGYRKALDFFETFVTEHVSLTPREAEIAKLITNMYRYVTFAFANEMWMIGEKQNIDIHKVIEAANYNYDRMNMPLPGPNVGGPCLFKDGRFLLQDVPYIDLIQTSFIINEGMPDYIYNCIKTKNTNVKKVLILGAAFKANCDDTRNSLSYKMKKVCKKHGVTAHMIDLYVPNDDTLSPYEDYDAVIVMTPHDDFKLYDLRAFRKDCVIADVWKFFTESKGTTSGIYEVGEIYG